MSDPNMAFDGLLSLSRHLDYFQHENDYYVHHNLYGYILKMSEDVLEFLEYFRPEARTGEQALEMFDERFSDGKVGEFANVLALQRCLMDPSEPEEDFLLPYYPVLAPWAVYHQPNAENVTIYSLDQSTREHVFVAGLNEWDSALWRKIDGEKTCEELIEVMRSVEGSPVSGLKERFFATLEKLTHHNMQAIKLSSKPMSFFEGRRRHLKPPYLRSVMPYECITDLVRGEKGMRVNVPGLRREAIDPALITKEGDENALSVFFSKPHPALDGETYGGRLLKLLKEREVTDGARILEIGGGVGVMALNILNTLQTEDPERYAQVHYVLLQPNAVRAEAARELLASHACAVVLSAPIGDLSDALKDEDNFHIILCNEFIADLESLPVRRVSRDLPDEEEEGEEGEEESDDPGKADLYLGEGDTVNLIFRMGLPLEDAPTDFFLNTGAIKLLEASLKKLDEEGQLCIIEFGEQFHYPKRSSDNAATTFSIHFKILIHLAMRMGYEYEFGYLMEMLGFNRDLPLLATTRSHFRALRHMLAASGVQFDRGAYTKEQFSALLIEGGMEPESVHEIHYEALDERIFGLLTHSFKLLRVFKPVGIPSAMEM